MSDIYEGVGRVGALQKNRKLNKVLQQDKGRFNGGGRWVGKVKESIWEVWLFE